MRLAKGFPPRELQLKGDPACHDFTNKLPFPWAGIPPHGYSKENTGQRARLVGALAFAGLHGMSGTQVTRKIIERAVFITEPRSASIVWSGTPI
jgi:hypothetical protein